MIHQLDIPENVYSRLIFAARQQGTTPICWIEQHLPRTPSGLTESSRSMADMFGDSVGKFASSDDLQASERGSELFGEYLKQKQRVRSL
jgi:hypothetical protein